jgi:hypothetical protein
MFRSVALLGVAITFTVALAAAPVPEESPVIYIDLKPYCNHNRKDDFHSGNYPGNNLASLPAGKQTFKGVKFQIGDGVVQLGSSNVAGKPEKVEGIKVGRKFGKLSILHATGYSAPDDTVIGKYLINYDDKTTETIEIVFGKDVVDWWAYPGRAEPTRGKIAWEGENEPAKGFEAKIRLYLTIWQNPHPKKKVVTIDYVATAQDTGAAPFCVAMTAEESR